MNLRLAFAFVTVLFSINSFAVVRPIHCKLSEKQTVRSTSVSAGGQISVIVDDVNPSTGFTMVSAEGLQGEFISTQSGVRVGAGGMMVFKIKADDQDQKVATYTFEYKRPWEKVAAVSTCLVTVTKK